MRYKDLIKSPIAPADMRRAVCPRILRFLDLNNRVLVDKRIERRHHPMPSTDGFKSDDPLPLLLAELKQQDIDIGKAWDRAILTASILG